MFDATPEALRQLNAIIKGQQVQDVESTLNSMSEEKSKRLIKLELLDEKLNVCY